MTKFCCGFGASDLSATVMEKWAINLLAAVWRRIKTFNILEH